MIILPAIDLLDKQVVRLAQGKRDELTVYAKDPVEVAQRWVAAGATWMHVVDLNGAFEGTYTNLDLAKSVIDAVDINIELSGGIRTQETLDRAISAGASRVVLGTKACEDPAFVEKAVKDYGDKIAVAIDAKAGEVVSRGWVEGSKISAKDLTQQMLDLGVQTIICTDVSRDGMLQGPNQSLLEQVLDLNPPQLIASGGVSSIQDLIELKKLEPRGVKGAIVGRAVYEGKVDLKEAIEAVR